jgi:hydroxyacylglutathione hydrolase
MIQRLRLGSNSYLLQVEGGFIVVDTGMPWEWGKLGRALRGLQLRGVVLTHHHLDHVGGARRLWEERHVPVFVHSEDLPYIAGLTPRPPFPLPGLGAWLANLPRSLPREALTPVEEGEDLFGWRVVHLPGHTPGQIGLLRGDDFIAADAFLVRNRGPQPPAKAVSADLPEALRTLREIAALPFSTAWVGHGPPTTHEAVRRLVERLEQRGLLPS